MNKDSEDRPPVFGSWKGWYIFSVAMLVAIIALFTFLTNYFR